MGIDKYNYTVGDATYTAFITRVEKQSKGFNAVSLSNYDATGVCVITDGSAFEVAGSMYLCTTDTSITASVATGICYIMATGATATATVAWSTTAPVWRDDYQGYYATAASSVRAIGGIYFDGSSHLHKFTYKHREDIYKDYVSEIGDWNMDADAATTVADTLDKELIRDCTVFIRSDIGATDTPSLLNAHNRGNVQFNATTIALARAATEYFDSVDFNATSYNRGWVYVKFRTIPA